MCVEAQQVSGACAVTLNFPLRRVRQLGFYQGLRNIGQVHCVYMKHPQPQIYTCVHGEVRYREEYTIGRCMIANRDPRVPFGTVEGDWQGRSVWMMLRRYGI